MSHGRKALRLAAWAAVIASLMGCGEWACAQDAPAAGAEASEPYREPSPLLREPKTPDELFSSARLMVDLARLDLADRYLAQLLKDDLSDETLIALRDKHGTADFVRLTRVKELKANADTLLVRLNEASRRQAASAEYVGRLAEQLGQGGDERELAARALERMGVAAAAPLIHLLVSAQSAEQTDQIICALSRLGRPAIGPLTAALDAPQDSVRQAVLSALGNIHSRAAVPFLWHPAFYEQEPAGTRQAAQQVLTRILSNSDRRMERLSGTAAADELRKISRDLYYRRYELPLEGDSTVVVWSWNDEVQTVSPKAYAPDEAGLLLATRFAREAFDLAPDHPESQRIYLASLLGWTVATQGRDRPLPIDPGSPGYVALTAGQSVMSGVLGEALAAGQPGTAQGAIQILKRIGSQQEIFAGNGRKTPLLSALNYPDARVQFAAADAVLQAEPRQTFPGASRVMEILIQAITNSTEAKALIIDADRERAEVTARYLANLGYLPIKVRTGKEGFTKAAAMAGIDLIVLDINCIQWDLSQTVANLRADSRTAFLPIVLYGPEDVADIQTPAGRRNALAFPEAASPIWKGTLPPGGRIEPIESTTRLRIARLLGRSQPAIFVAESGTAADFEMQIRPFLSAVGGSTLSDSERAERRTAAVEWLARLAVSENQGVFPLQSAETALVDLIDDSELAPQALTSLSAIGTAGAQGRLLTIALSQHLDPPLRVQAARSLAQHMQRFGVSLKEGQVEQLYAGWKAERDPAMTTALAAVIGTLGSNQQAVGERLNTLRPVR